MAKIKVPSKLPIKEFKCKDVYGREYVLSYTDAPMVEYAPVVRCKDCVHRFVDGENVRFNVCELNHNKVQADDWFCADGVKKDYDDCRN